MFTGGVGAGVVAGRLEDQVAGTRLQAIVCRKVTGGVFTCVGARDV